jgi:site-specific DNA-methyltransferase (adenine-specific)
MIPKNSTIHCGDCLEVMKNMPSKSVDIIFTSPPYNMGRSRGVKTKNHLDGGKTRAGKLRNGYASHGDDLEYEQYVLWQKTVLLECWRLLKDDGAIFYNHKPRLQLGLLYTPLDLNPGLPVRQVIVWDRKSGFNATPAAYASCQEWVVLFAKPEFRLRNRAVSMIGDVWSFGPEKRNPHPAPFPVDLPLKALETVTGQVVLDCFAGSGTTGIACLATNKKFIGIEVSKDYCELMKRRLYLAEQGDFESWNLIGA